MIIDLIRYPRKDWGIDGMLRINGKKVCDTVEHPTRRFPSGTYDLNIRNHPFRRGDGALRSVNGEIIVGERVLSGLVTHSADTYERLYDRLKKEWQRGNSVTLRVL